MDGWMKGWMDGCLRIRREDSWAEKEIQNSFNDKNYNLPPLTFTTIWEGYVWLFPFYKWGSCSSEKLRLVNSRAGILAYPFPNLKPLSWRQRKTKDCRRAEFPINIHLSLWIHPGPSKLCAPMHCLFVSIHLRWDSVTCNQSTLIKALSLTGFPIARSLYFILAPMSDSIVTYAYLSLH